MRRLLSICLFAATLMPLVAPLLSTGAAAQTGMAACCRREGKHHCMMGSEAALLASDGQHRVLAPREICPYQQRAVAPAHYEQSAVAVATVAAVALLREPSAPAQAECLRRISFDRSRQKRGPPVVLS